MWEGGLLPIAVYQSLVYSLIHRYREQVESSHRPSHIGFSVYQKMCSSKPQAL